MSYTDNNGIMARNQFFLIYAYPSGKYQQAEAPTLQEVAACIPESIKADESYTIVKLKAGSYFQDPVYFEDPDFDGVVEATITAPGRTVVLGNSEANDND